MDHKFQKQKPAVDILGVAVLPAGLLQPLDGLEHAAVFEAADAQDAAAELPGAQKAGV